MRLKIFCYKKKDFGFQRLSLYIKDLIVHMIGIEIIVQNALNKDRPYDDCYFTKIFLSITSFFFLLEADIETGLLIFIQTALISFCEGGNYLQACHCSFHNAFIRFSFLSIQSEVLTYMRTSLPFSIGRSQLVFIQVEAYL